MPSNYVSKFNLNDQEVIVKDSEARTTANTASTNATNALNKVTELESSLVLKLPIRKILKRLVLLLALIMSNNGGNNIWLKLLIM